MKKKAKPINRKELETMLHGIIRSCLGMPRGDPDVTHMTVAGIAYNSLVHFGFDPMDDEVFNFLTKDNIYKVDFLKEKDWDGRYFSNKSKES